MAEYRVFFRRSVWKDLDRIAKRDIQRIMRRIRGLAQNPRPPGCERLSGEERYRIRQGKYRILYSIEDRDLIVYVVKIGHRRDIYRRKG